MTEIFSNCSDPRQAALLCQILEATEKHQQRDLQLLQIKWAHRYGIGTLPNAESIYSLTIAEESLENAELKTPQLKKDDSDEDISSHPQTEELNLLDLSTDEQSSSEDFAVSTFSRLKTALNGCIDEVNNVFKEKKNEAIVSIETSTKDNFNACAPSPPPRQLNRLSRWLPEVEESFPEAS